MKLGKRGLRWWDGGVVGEGLDSPRGGRVNRTRLHRSHLLWLSEKLVRQGFKITKLRSAGGNWVTGSFGEKSKLTELKSKRFPHWPEPLFGMGVCTLAQFWGRFVFVWSGPDRPGFSPHKAPIVPRYTHGSQGRSNLFSFFPHYITEQWNLKEV